LLCTPTWPPSLCHLIPLGMSENQELDAKKQKKTKYFAIWFIK
jgi:hypothetical protein